MHRSTGTRASHGWQAAVLFVCICAPSAWGGSRVDIPKPTDPLQPAPPPPALGRSVANIDILLPVDELADAADQAFPQVAAREDGWNDAPELPGRQDVRFLYRLVRGGFKYRMEQDQFVVRFDDIRYRIWMRQSLGGSVMDSRCGHNGDPPKLLRVIARSELSWSDTWRLRAKTTIDPAVIR